MAADVDVIVVGSTPDAQTPRWVFEAPTLRDLADKVGIDPEALIDQVEHFNKAAAEGLDPIFHRGESAYDGYRGDKNVAYLIGLARSPA